jgi:hypothetical protein
MRSPEEGRERVRGECGGEVEEAMVGQLRLCRIKEVANGDGFE